MRTEKPQTAVMARESHGRGLRKGLRRRFLVQVAITEGVDVNLADAVSSFPVVHYEIRMPLPRLLLAASLGRAAIWRFGIASPAPPAGASCL